MATPTWSAILTIGASVLMLWAAFFHEDEDAKEKMANGDGLFKQLFRRIR